jgi:hypothetical protein
VLEERRAADGARVVDEDVDAAEVVDDGLHRGIQLAGRRRGEVELLGERGSPERLKPRDGLARLRAVEQRHLGARLGQREGRGLAEPARGAGDERDLPVEPERIENHAVSLSDVSAWR